MFPREGEFAYGSCGNCGLWRQDPLPSAEAIASFYPPGYGPHRVHERRPPGAVERWFLRSYYDVRSLDRPAWLRLPFRLFSRRVLRHLRAPHGACRMLDVGCGSGDLLARHRDLGWQVRGVEFAPEAAQKAIDRGLEVHVGSLESAGFTEERFDRILLSHVIEHVLDPVGLLQRCAQLLDRDGILEVWTPNVRSLGRRLYGACWFPLDAPRHVTLFDSRSLREAAARAGLQPIFVKCRPSARFLWESACYRRFLGTALPANAADRERSIDRCRSRRGELRWMRRFFGPFTLAASGLGFGELLEARFQRGSPQK